MNKKKIIKIAIFCMTILLLFYIIYLNKKLMSEYYLKQNQLNQICSLVLNEVVISYSYDSMDKTEIRVSQKKDITNLKTASKIIPHTSWPKKDKILEMDLTLYEYLITLYNNNQVLDDLGAKNIMRYYTKILVNIDNNECIKDIDSLLEVIQEGIREMQ